MKCGLLFGALYLWLPKFVLNYSKVHADCKNYRMDVVPDAHVGSTLLVGSALNFAIATI